jgi:hypothetical protein
MWLFILLRLTYSLCYRSTTLTAEEQRHSSERLSRSTVNINKEHSAPRHTQPPRPPPPRPSPPAVQLSSLHQGQRSTVSANTVVKDTMPTISTSDSITKSSLDRNALPEGLVETMDHIVGQVNEFY